MKVRKIIFYVCIVITTFLIYRVASNNKINYVTIINKTAENNEKNF